jgi:predicted neuraminidase
MQWTAVIRCRISEDNGATWGPIETFSDKPSSFCRQPMVVLSNGDWLFPMYYSVRGVRHADDYSVMRISENQGVTWTEYPIPGSRGRVHPSVLEIASSRLVTFFRSRAADRIYRSQSEDYGRTWSAPERTPLPNNNASIQALKLASGNIAIIFNNISSDDDDSTKSVWLRERYPVTVAISEDEGNTWPYMRHIDTSDDFCGAKNIQLNRRCEYPCIMQTRDGMLHMGYSYRDRQCIKYVRVSEDWVRDGFFAGDDSAYFTTLFG